MAEEEVFELLRSVIMSQKGGVLLQDLNRDYISLAGEPIPYVKLGYKCIEGLLDNIPEINKSVNQNGQTLYTSAGKNCEHLVGLISKQKSSKNTKPNYATKINHWKNKELLPICNEYSYNHQSRGMGHRSTKLRTNTDAHESWHKENSNKDWKRRNHPQTYGDDTRYKDQRNFREKPGQALHDFNRSEEEMYALSQRQRESRNSRTNGAPYYDDSFYYEEESPPLHEFSQVSRNSRMNQVHNHKPFRFKEAHSQYGYSANYDHLCSDMNQSVEFYESHRCERELPSARHKECRSSAINHFSGYRDQIYREDAYHRGSRRHVDNFSENHNRYQEPQHSRRGSIPDDYGLERYDREPFYDQRSYNSHIYESERNHSWEDGGNWEHRRYMRDYGPSYMNRKIDLVSGNLIVTIKNF